MITHEFTSDIRDDLRFLHLRFYPGAVTFAYTKPDLKGLRFMGLSICSEKDNFCKAKGREKALERLNASPIMIYDRPDRGFIDNLIFSAIGKNGWEADLKDMKKVLRYFYNS